MAMFRRRNELNLGLALKSDGSTNLVAGGFSDKLVSRVLIFLVFSLFFVSLFSGNVFADQTGCYLYGNGDSSLVCNSNVLESEATADCEGHSDCDISAMFIPNAQCSDYSECDEVLCSVDCDYHSQTVCVAEGGRALDASEEELWCSEGCCMVADFCEYVTLQYECVEKAEQRGLGEDDITMITGADVDSAYCQNLCGVELEAASLFGVVYDSEGEVLSGASLVLSSEHSAVSGSDGSYSFSSVDVGSYLMEVSLEGYESSSHTVSLNSGEVAELDIVLGLEGESFTISGSVVTDTGEVVGSASICYVAADGSEGCSSSDSAGAYSFEGLVSGDYTFTVTRYGYESTETVVSVSGDTEIDLVIGTIDFQGVVGYTYLDENGNGEVDSDESTVYGASIYVDSVLMGSSSYPDGDYLVYLEEGTYTVFAAYQDYSSEEYEIDVALGETVDLTLLLTKEIGECSYGQENDQKPVEEINAEVSVGEAIVSLSWSKPCAEVSGYLLERDGWESPEALSPLATSYSDTDVEWGESYTYSIWAVYTDGPLEGEEVRYSSSSADVSVTIGSEACEGREAGDVFCLVDDDSSSENERKYVYTCDSSNNIVASTDCTALDDEDSNYFCSATSSGTAICKDAGECSVWSQSADPFGLYYESSSCYGGLADTGYDNFCYYDYSSSIVDACYSCEAVTNCFDYASSDACSVNNCLGQSCSWIDATAADDELLDYSAIFPVTKETGHGYCVPSEEEEIEAAGNEFCSLCGSEGMLFENNYCMPEVCNSLGSCFSDSDASECLECYDSANSEANCYTYNSELECNGGQNVAVSSGAVVGSNDQCSWNVCAWQESSTGDADASSYVHSFFADTGYCYKDGNGDGVDDCSSFSSGEYSSCQSDVNPPETYVVTDSFEVVSLADTDVTFSSEDEKSPLLELGYCLASADASSCDDFEIVMFDGLVNLEEVVVNLTNSSFINGSVIDGESYLLRYYAMDKYYNQESVKETYVFIDTEEPSFDIEYEASTEADVSDFSVYLSNMNEPMSCDFALSEVLPEGGESVVSVDREGDKEAAFLELYGVIYGLVVSCIDDYGNVGVSDLEIVFDLEQDITLVYPEYDGVVAESEISFQIETAVSAYCTLYDTTSGATVAGFEADSEGKSHVTAAVDGFYEGDYAGTVGVVCESLLDGEVLEDYFYFTVDYTGPDTQIVLTEGNRTEEPESYGFEEYFVESVSVGFECSSEGFECLSTYYCLGDECEYASSEGYVEFAGDLEIVESTSICYYSVDEGGFYGYPDCGEILIEGYGLILVSPEQYYYEGEIWGVSNLAVFDWSFTTKVDTGQCAFDFNDGFDIYSQPEYKTIFESDTVDNYYVYSDFPGEVLSAYPDSGDVKSLYVTCEDYTGEVGPATLMNLEYDPSAPLIDFAYVDPDYITEGIETFVYVDTDDKTVCKFSDLTAEDGGSYEFDTMEYSFPGYDASGDEYSELDYSHSSDFEFSFSGASKDFELAVQCMNGAGDLSSSETVEFSVDYSVEGYIVSAEPSGYHLPGEFSLEVETSKNAECTSDLGVFESTGGTYHSQYLGSLDEGEHQYYVSCQIGEVTRETEIVFSVDATAPVIDSVDDGSYTCSLDSISFVSASNDTDIASYYYEIYMGDSAIMDDSLGDMLGEDFNETDVTGSTMVSSGTLPYGENGSVSVGLEENTSYYVVVSAYDETGNVGIGTSSDGFIAISEDNEICVSDDTEPEVVVTTGAACSAVAVSLDCNDDLGCSEVYYGKSADSESCVADIVYYGGALSYDSSGWICYSAVDNSGNNLTGSYMIEFDDTDGDGVADNCDLCSGTSAGSAVNSDGCSYGQLSDSDNADGTDDKDSDGLPDTWEKLFDQTACEFNYLSQDSDSNGVQDGDDDYDGDGLRNYEEYRNGYNPCLSDAPSNVVDPESGSESPVSPPSSGGGGSSDRGFVGLILFVLGVLMLAFGIGGLVYYYTQTLPGKKVFGAGGAVRGGGLSSGAAGGPSGSRGASVVRGSKPSSSAGAVNREAALSGAGMLSNLRDKVMGLRSVHEKKRRSTGRRGVFDSFTQETGHLAAFEKHINAKGDSLKRLDKLTDTYKEHKNDVHGGLHGHEKSVFDKLDHIVKIKEKTGHIENAATKKDADDIFKKLKGLSDKRKS